jgi:hypothetical protein
MCLAEVSMKCSVLKLSSYLIKMYSFIYQKTRIQIYFDMQRLPIFHFEFLFCFELNHVPLVFLCLR